MIKPEKKLQDKCIEWLKARGVYYNNNYGDGFSGKGKPDLYVCVKGLFVAFELKHGYNDLQDDQKIHKIRIERSGGLHYAPYTLDEFISIMEELLK
ncbi:MAG: hypothetical protein VZQ55_05510 [Ruminococcus sp.]|nr:hypothetical protein [Ruminococcus sp.]